MRVYEAGRLTSNSFFMVGFLEKDAPHGYLLYNADDNAAEVNVDGDDCVDDYHDVDNDDN